MKIANNGIDIMERANLQQIQKAAQSVGKKPEKLPDGESGRSVKRDEYISSEKDEPIGLYSMEQDENGNPKIKLDSPESKPANKPDEPDKADKPEKEKSESEECTCNTDKVDRELERLREKAERLEQQLRSASDEEAEKLQKQLAAAQSELAQKDNDTYRKSHAEFS